MRLTASFSVSRRKLLDQECCVTSFHTKGWPTANVFIKPVAVGQFEYHANTILRMAASYGGFTVLQMPPEGGGPRFMCGRYCAGKAWGRPSDPPDNPCWSLKPRRGVCTAQRTDAACRTPAWSSRSDQCRSEAAF